MKYLLFVLSLLSALTTRAQTPDAGVVTLQPLYGHPAVRENLVLYYPALALRLRMTAVAWVRATAAPDGAVTTASLERLDSVVVHFPDSAEVAELGAQAQTELVSEAIKRVKSMKLVPTAAPQTYLVPVRYGTGIVWQAPTRRAPIHRSGGTRPPRRK